MERISGISPHQYSTSKRSVHASSFAQARRPVDHAQGYAGHSRCVCPGLVSVRLAPAPSSAPRPQSP